MKLPKVYKYLFFLFLFITVERSCHWQTHGFRLNKVSTSHKYPHSTSIHTPPSAIHQPFYFLDSGVQSYVFIGKDKKTILKLYKHYHFGIPIDLLKKIFPKKIYEPIIKSREKRMCGLFKSAEIAFQILPEETKVFYTHLQKTDSLLGNIQIIDKLGISYSLNLDQTEFILQKKAEPAYQTLHFFFRNKKIDEAIFFMKKIISLIENRSKKGIKNKDGKVLKNYGFLDDHVVEMDVSSYAFHKYSSNSHPSHKAKWKATLQLLHWIKKNHIQYFQRCKEALLNENTF